MPAIDSVKYGEIKIEGKTYYSDMVVWWDKRKAMIKKSHILNFSLAMKLLKRKPEAIVVGIGLKGTVHILPEFLEKLEDKKIKLFVDKTDNAVDIYNALLKEGKKVVAVLHVSL